MVCPKQGPEMEGDVLLRVVILVFFCCPKQGQVSIPSAAPHPNLGQVSPPLPPRGCSEALRDCSVALRGCSVASMDHVTVQKHCVTAQKHYVTVRKHCVTFQ